MADRPILIFPAATVSARAAIPKGFEPPRPRPTKAQQRQRLSERFQALSKKFGEVRADVGGIDPEQVIVFETVGSITGFQNVVKKIPGLEWLGDFDTDIAEPAQGFLADGTTVAQLPGRLFVVVSKRSAYDELLKLWRQWGRSRTEKLSHGFGRLAEVFKHLQDIRVWGPKDRVLSTGILVQWEKGLSDNVPTLRFEAELWCRSQMHNAAFERFRTVINEIGGQCVAQSVVTEIDYHGVLVDLPASVVQKAVEAIRSDTDTKFLRVADVKYFSPMGQASLMPLSEGNPIEAAAKPLPTKPPVVAILDGVPLTNHYFLQDRFILDDPDNLTAQYQLGEHRHGTAMLSLVVHGELDAGEQALESKVYFRPIMVPGQADRNGIRQETFPPNELTIDIIHRAVRRMYEGDGAVGAQASSVKAINVSIGDASQLFDRHLSALARLLDWLSHKYQVLFVVSAGNHLDDITLPFPATSIQDISDIELRSHTLRAMAQQRISRRLLAPAESINALTIGALHSQTGVSGPTGRLFDLLRAGILPSPISTVANGFRRSIKPDLIVPGGRRYYAPKLIPSSAQEAEFEISGVVGQPGQLVATPGGTAIPPSNATRTSGTSNAAAITTRQAARLYVQIKQLRTEQGGDALGDRRIAAILKAMLVHGASWGNLEEFLDQVFDGPDNGQERWWRIKRACTQFFGYGIADFDRGTVCTDQRVVVLGCGELAAEEAHLYKVPLPPALHAQTIQRRLTITLAWLTPVNPRHRYYRIADLWFEPPEDGLQVKRRECDHTSPTRGTVQHEVLEGNSAVPITDGDTLPIQVNCRSVAGSKLTERVPYALMVSLEVAEPLGVSIYEQVKLSLERIREATRVRPTVRPVSTRL